jgi:type VI protein secretion system component Hcp
MNLKKLVFLWAVVIALAQPGIAVAASDVFMCIDGIDGGSTDSQFEHCSNVFGVSYSVGVLGSAPPSAGGNQRLSTTCGSYVVSKPLDTASVPLMIRSLVQRRISEVQFPVRTRSGDESTVFFQLTLHDVLIVTVEQNLDGQVNEPSEKIVMQPLEIEWVFTPRDPLTGKPAGSTAGGFDCARNRAT